MNQRNASEKGIAIISYDPYAIPTLSQMPIYNPHLTPSPIPFLS